MTVGLAVPNVANPPLSQYDVVSCRHKAIILCQFASGLLWLHMEQNEASIVGGCQQSTTTHYVDELE